MSTSKPYKINDGNITYKDELARPISVENGVIQVGTTKERLRDLLYQHPSEIKNTVEELYKEFSE